MHQTAKIIKFPTKVKTKRRSRIRSVDGVKYFNAKQIKLLRRTSKDQATTGKLTHIREWMVIDLLSCT